jgi:hypothetical protein
MMTAIGRNRREYIPIRSHGDNKFPNSVIRRLIRQEYEPILSNVHYYRKIKRAKNFLETISDFYN